MDQQLIDHFVEHFDHHDPRLGADPDEVCEALLERAPVAYSDKHGGFWVVSDYESSKRVLQDAKVFTSEEGVRVPRGEDTPPLPPIEMDPPLHSKFRSILAPAFSPRSINALEPRIRALTNDLIDAFEASGSCDFVEDLAAPLPTGIFTQIMGLPIEDAPRFYAWKNVILHESRTDEDYESAARATGEVMAYLKQILDERRVNPQDDIATQIVQAEGAGESITEEELVRMAFLLFLGGLDTVTAALSLTFTYLATHPDDRDRLVKDPDLIPTAIEEFLRRDAVILIGRVAREDVEVGGQQMKAGDRILVNTIAANRDGAQFADADEVQLDREANRHVTFGLGPHRCVGSHLARLEMQVVLEEFHRRIPTYRLAEGFTPTRHMNQVAGVEELRLAW
ncbi:cytochrome P450 [Nocardioides sp. BP30]|uniref:cytochrome P450 n=1 Tax=Nocardioides sp. BP30 TaxID=3036374 RepID=UPI0024682BA1|nr:cytochrome P450 [Nocardioides sp. BP30]WGL54155.1 cytochrome P450 [Nocardioides sp. BP30]